MQAVAENKSARDIIDDLRHRQARLSAALTKAEAELAAKRAELADVESALRVLEQVLGDAHRPTVASQALFPGVARFRGSGMSLKKSVLDALRKTGPSGATSEEVSSIIKDMTGIAPQRASLASTLHRLRTHGEATVEAGRWRLAAA